MGQKDLALGRTVDGQAGAGVRHDAQLVPGFHLVQGDDAAALADGEHHRCAGALGQMLHVGAGHAGDVPLALHLAAVLKQAQAQGVLALRRLGDDIIGPHGGQQAEHRALGVAGALRQLRQGQGLFRPAQGLQQLHGLGHGQYDVAVHHDASPSFPCIIAHGGGGCQGGNALVKGGRSVLYTTDNFPSKENAPWRRSSWPLRPLCS